MTTSEHLDVLIVGAGLSGIGAAARLSRDAPQQRWLVLEARDRWGGTWDQFRYPGVRSDSDMATLAFPFKPWTAAEAIVDGATILRYLDETVAEHGLADRIRCGHRLLTAAWDSPRSQWSVAVQTAGGTVEMTATFLYFCSGYFSHDAAHRPTLTGQVDFVGQIVHPQFWPDDLEVAGRDVVVLGSGATAVTLAPALADAGAQVTVVQRSPGWVTALPRRRSGPRSLAGVRADAQVEFCRATPHLARWWLTRQARRRLPAGYDVETHFTSPDDPWDQRLCVAADGDLFAAIRRGHVEMVTDRVDHLDPDGVRLVSGRHLATDLVVTATGLRLNTFGGARLSVDGAAVAPHDLVVRHEVMFSGVPNLAWCLGSPRQAWTRRADRGSRFVVELVERLRTEGLASATPWTAPRDAGPMLDLKAGYVQRVADWMPRADPTGVRSLDEAMTWR